MGEKGNVTSGELVGAASGMGVVAAGAGTQVTAVFEEAADKLTDTVIDKGADTGIGLATDAWNQRKGDDSDEPASDASTSG